MKKRNFLLSINYHYIRPKFSGHGGINGVTPSDFEKQILILKNELNIISAYDLLDFINQGEILESSVIITFDDGLLEQYKYAAPILAKHAIPAVFFSGSGHILDGRIEQIHKSHILRDKIPPENFSDLLGRFLEIWNIRIPDQCDSFARAQYLYDSTKVARDKYLLNFVLNDSLRTEFLDGLFREMTEGDDDMEWIENLYMSSEQLGSLADLGIALGSHCNRHVPLAAQGVSERMENMASSFRIFHDFLSFVPLLSYPYGGKSAVNSDVIKAAREVGYVGGFTMNRGLDFDLESPLALSRFSCSDVDFNDIGGWISRYLTEQS